MLFLLHALRLRRSRRRELCPLGVPRLLLLLVLLLLLTRASSLLPGFSLLPLEGSGSFGVWWWNTAAPTEGCFCLRLLVEFLSASFCRSFSFFSFACSSIARRP